MATGAGRKRGTRARAGAGRGRAGGGVGCPGSTSPQPPPRRPAAPRPRPPTLAAGQEVTGPREPPAWRSRGAAGTRTAGGAGSGGRVGHLPPRLGPRPSRKGRRRRAAEAERPPSPALRWTPPARTRVRSRARR
ncbi:translation initiation factor IF-2-like [Phodopus roborovskii]|uniref:translation initiation factor IF-2-like n=1 Tax=Phodopus roborovskii TaxID=109678 RepID=UPI0021E4D61F|nr:translation initiation factor IF-2-like [Phodopus roborovskii]